MDKFTATVATIIVSSVAICWAIGLAPFFPGDASVRAAAMFSLLFLIVGAAAIVLNKISEASSND